jgi:hypothetical protein
MEIFTPQENFPSQIVTALLLTSSTPQVEIFAPQHAKAPLLTSIAPQFVRCPLLKIFTPLHVNAPLEITPQIVHVPLETSVLQAFITQHLTC